MGLDKQALLQHPTLNSESSLRIHDQLYVMRIDPCFSVGEQLWFLWIESCPNAFACSFVVHSNTLSAHFFSLPCGELDYLAVLLIEGVAPQSCE